MFDREAPITKVVTTMRSQSSAKIVWPVGPKRRGEKVSAFYVLEDDSPPTDPFTNPDRTFTISKPQDQVVSEFDLFLSLFQISNSMSVDSSELHEDCRPGSKIVKGSVGPFMLNYIRNCEEVQLNYCLRINQVDPPT